MGGGGPWPKCHSDVDCDLNTSTAPRVVTPEFQYTAIAIHNLIYAPNQNQYQYQYHTNTSAPHVVTL